MGSGKISVVIPVFNEEEGLVLLLNELKASFRSISLQTEIVFINDGSKDGSLNILAGFAHKDTSVKVINFTRNFGHQKAVMAGLAYCSGDAAIIMDADLQDPPYLIAELVNQWQKGFDVVYGIRKKRLGEGIFKRLTAHLFYKIMKALTPFEIPMDTGDFRLIDRKVIDLLSKMPEKEKFLRGLISWTGFKQMGVEYQRNPRVAGKTNYSLSKMVGFALNGLTSFTIVPLRISIVMGFVTILISILYALHVLYLHYFTDQTIVGWSSLVIIMLFIGGVQLFILGIMGVYLGNINNEVKARPAYVIDSAINF